MLNPGPIRAAGGLKEFRRRRGFHRKMQGDLAVAKSIEELPGGKLPVSADLKIPRADSAEMHSSVRVFVGKITAGFAGSGEGFAPALELVRRKLESGPGGSTEQGRRARNTHQ